MNLPSRTEDDVQIRDVTARHGPERFQDTVDGNTSPEEEEDNDDYDDDDEGGKHMLMCSSSSTL